MRRRLPSVIAFALIVAAAIGLARYGGMRPAGTAAAAPGAVDIGFAQAMSRHHLQAIGMAQIMLDGRPTPLASLARSIAWSQLAELGEMRGWLHLWDQPLYSTTQSMDWMLLGEAPPGDDLTRYLLDCRRSPTGMAGLATDAEIEQLRQLDGRARDAHFLRLMLAHHQGGLPMARFAALNARLPAVRDLASRITLDQSEETMRMLRTLDAMAAGASD